MKRYAKEFKLSTAPQRSLDSAEVRRLFWYSEALGTLMWDNPPKEHAELKNKIAGSSSPKGYWKIQINGKKYSRSRLVFLYHYNRFPFPIVDHINRVRGDDRIENLREVTHYQNAINNGKNSVTKRASGRWQARIGQYNLGMFNTREEAEVACINKKADSFSI